MEFANQLRGVAAMLVAASHLVGVYWGMRGFVAAATFSPPQPGQAPSIYSLVGYSWYQAGPLGVALFFLISGLVIPFSLRHHSRLTFIAARLLRIYPTFMLATLCEMLLLIAAARYWRIPFAHGPRTVLAEFLLLSDFAGTPVIDFVSWTLSVELKFYILMTIFAGAIRRGSFAALFGVAIAILMADILLFLHPMPPWLANFGMESPYLIFMLIGVFFYFQHAQRRDPRFFVLAVFGMVGLFLVSWRLSPERAEYPIVTANYLVAILLFAACYAGRRHFPKIPALDFMASISYPFYLIHAVFGFTIIKLLMLRGRCPYDFALLVTIVLLALLAFVLHRTVERASINWGRGLAHHKFDKH